MGEELPERRLSSLQLEMDALLRKPNSVLWLRKNDELKGTI